MFLFTGYVNSSPEDQGVSLELNETPIALTHGKENHSSEGHTSNFPDDLLPTVTTTIEISTHKLRENPIHLFSTHLPITNPEVVDGASIPTIQEPDQKNTTNDLPASTQHSQNETYATEENFASPKDSKVNQTKDLLIDITTLADQNEGNLDSFFPKRQDKSASIDYQPKGMNVFSSSVATSPFSLNTSSDFPDLTMHNQSSHDNTLSSAVNEIVSNQNFTLKSEFSTETTSITLLNKQTISPNLSETTDRDIIIENRTVTVKDDEEYTVIVPKICSNKSIINRLLHLLNSLPNNKRPANFSCEKLKDMKIALKSRQLFDKINEFLKEEAKTDDMVFIKVGSNATLSFEILPQSSFDGVYIPMFVVIIIGCLVAWLLIIILCIYLYKKFCRRHSTSLDLHHIPHLNLKADYNLTPIPRPSISFPDGNRDFLHAFAHDNYNLSRQENTLNKRNSSCTIAKTYEEVDKEIRSKQELSTFTMSSGKKSEIKPSTSHDYGSPHTWDRLQEKNYVKKYGVDNPGYRKW